MLAHHRPFGRCTAPRFRLVVRKIFFSALAASLALVFPRWESKLLYILHTAQLSCTHCAQLPATTTDLTGKMCAAHSHLLFPRVHQDKSSGPRMVCVAVPSGQARPGGKSELAWQRLRNVSGNFFLVWPESFEPPSCVPVQGWTSYVVAPIAALRSRGTYV